MRLIDADALMKKAWDADTRIGYVQVVDVGEILDAPTIEPERQKGQWIDDERSEFYYANCSECGYQMDVHTERGYFNFCPNCGADMR